MNEYTNAQKFGIWKVKAIQALPGSIGPEALGYALQKLDIASLNNDGTITICPVHRTRREAEKLGYEAARKAVEGLNWKE